MRTRLHIAAVLLGAAVILTGCAQSRMGSSAAGSSASPAPAVSASSSAPTAPSPSPAGSAATLVLTGQVEAGVEPRCLVLRSGAESYLLVGGDPAVVKAGARVRVTGHLAVGMMSYCMQGKLFQVTSAQPS